MRSRGTQDVCKTYHVDIVCQCNKVYGSPPSSKSLQSGDLLQSAFQGGRDMIEVRRGRYWSMGLDDEHALKNLVSYMINSIGEVP